MQESAELAHDVMKPLYIAFYNISHQKASRRTDTAWPDMAIKFHANLEKLITAVGPAALRAKFLSNRTAAAGKYANRVELEGLAALGLVDTVSDGAAPAYFYAKREEPHTGKKAGGKSAKRGSSSLCSLCSVCSSSRAAHPGINFVFGGAEISV